MLAWCNYPEVAGQTREAVENMFAGLPKRVFDEMTEIEFEDGTLACYFNKQVCYQSVFFTNDESK